MESRHQETLATFRVTIIMAIFSTVMIMGLALVEKRLSEKGSSEMSLSDALNEVKSLPSSKPSDKIQEDLHPSESSTITASSLSAISPTEREHRTAASVPPTLALPRMVFSRTDLFRDNATAMIQTQYPLWQKGHFWKADLIIPKRQDSALQCLLKAARSLDMLKESDRIGSIYLEMAYLLHFLCYKEFIQSHVRTDSGAIETFLKHLYTTDWNQVDKEVQLKRRALLQNKVSIGKRWYITVGKLSYGAIILCGKKLSTVM